MDILAHRGYWKTEADKNQLEALSWALQNGYGIETDIRDYREELVISHDMGTPESALLEDFFSVYSGCGSRLPLALNIKADGIQQKLKLLLEQFSISNYFLFDMSVPEMAVSRKQGLNFFTRHSDIEGEYVLYEYAQGVWMDSFYDAYWLTGEMIGRHLSCHKKVGIISPEIHGFDNCHLWEMIKTRGFHQDKNVMLCTDKPYEAGEYFGL